MTNEEAHRILSNGLVNAPSEHEWCMAFEMAIKALEQQWERDVAIGQLKELGYELGEKIEPCDDAVSRKAVDELSKELVHTTRDKADFLCNFWEGLQKLPSVTPTCEEREKGECPYYAG